MAAMGGKLRFGAAPGSVRVTAMDAKSTLNLMIDRYDPPVADDARQAIAYLEKLLPTATRLVYDNYNALAIGFGATDKASAAILSLAVYPRYVSLFLLNGATLEDPHGLLEGSGSKARHIKLRPLALLKSAEVLSLIDAAIAQAAAPLPDEGAGPLIIKSVSAKQRPRR